MNSSRVVTVGIDGSEASTAALRCAATEAVLRHSTVRVVRAYSLPVYGGDVLGGMTYAMVDPKELCDATTKAVESQVAPIRAEFPTVTFVTHVELKPAAGAILDASGDAELIVVGSHGKGALSAVFLGSVAHSVAHHATCPVLLVPAGDRAVSGRIVVGTDGSTESQAAVEWAYTEASLRGAALTLVHTWDYPYVEILEGVQQMESQAKVLLSQVRDSLPADSAVPVESRLIQGPAAACLIDAASDADLLVVGARGRGPVRSILLGSTSSYAMHHARSPIAVVRATS